MTNQAETPYDPYVHQIEKTIAEHRQALKQCLTCLEVWDTLISRLPLHQLEPDTPWGIIIDAVQDAIATYSSRARGLYQEQHE